MLLRLQFEINDFDTDVNGNNGSERKTTLKARVDRGDLLVGHRYRPLIPLKPVSSVPVRIKWFDSGVRSSECRRIRLRQLATIPQSVSLERLDSSRHVVVEHCIELT
jgi:hypothetical protein